MGIYPYQGVALLFKHMNNSYALWESKLTNPNTETKDELIVRLKKENDSLKARNEDLEWSRNFHAQDADKWANEFHKMESNYFEAINKWGDDLQRWTKALDNSSRVVEKLRLQLNAADNYVRSLLC